LGDWPPLSITTCAKRHKKTTVGARFCYFDQIGYPQLTNPANIGGAALNVQLIRLFSKTDLSGFLQVSFSQGQKMKKSLIALAVLGAVAGVAQAQTNVTIYGVLDAGVTKSTGTTTAINSGDNNRLGFKGTEDLGGGLKAIFQIEQRFDVDTGTTEGAGTRPLFQGQSTVGLQGEFGEVKIGRALTAKQLAAGAFDPWGATRARGAFSPDLADGGYNSSVTANHISPDAAGNRFSNAVFYASPVMSGFQALVSVATKEAQAGVTPDQTPYSLAGTYSNGPLGAAVTYERNNVDTKFWSLDASYQVGPAKLMGSYAQVKQGLAVVGVPATATTLATPAIAADAKTKAWMLGARVTAGPGDVLVGYGQSNPDGADNTTKKFAIGYEYKLSKRTYVYADAINRKTDSTQPQNLAGDTSINTFDIGLHHNF
jgi:predicted porin